MASQPKSEDDVTYEDQQQINTFSKLHLRSKDILAEIKVKKVSLIESRFCFGFKHSTASDRRYLQSEVEELEDAGNELILADEEEVWLLS